MKYESVIKVKLIYDNDNEIELTTNDIGKRATIITKGVPYENCIITSLNVDAMKIRSGDYNVTYRIEYENIISIKFNEYNLLMKEKYRKIFYSGYYATNYRKYLCYKPISDKYTMGDINDKYTMRDISDKYTIERELYDLGNYRTSFTDEEIEEIKKDIPFLLEMFEKALKEKK